MPQIPMIETPPAPKFPHGFPTRDNCDPSNPYQAFLWMLIPLPNMGGQQLVLVGDYLQLISQRLWDLGARPTEPPTQDPPGRGSWWQGSPGETPQPPPFPPGFPTRENCDPANPYEAFLWMLVALPNMRGGQLVTNVDYLQLISQRLWELGARPTEPPTLAYRLPRGRDSWWQGHPGDWLPINESRRP